jgi:Icc protein
MQTSSDAVRFVQFTDPHLFADADGALRGTVTATSLKAVLDDIHRRRWPADFYAVTGDLIQDDTRQAYERFRDLTCNLDRPVYCLPGNHDVRPLMQQVLAGPPFHYCASRRQGAWLIVMIDSCIDHEACGHISDAELGRLRDEIGASDAGHVLICLHHPPLPMRSRWLDQVGLDNAATLLDLIAGHDKVRGVLFGHVHQAFDADYEGRRIIGTPSTCRQFKPGADTFAVDDGPPAYRQVTLHTDGRIDAELIEVCEDQYSR